MVEVTKVEVSKEEIVRVREVRGGTRGKRGRLSELGGA